MTAIGAEEKAAVMRVLDSGVLSGFLAGQLYGGPEVNALEEEWAAHFGFKHAVAMNSATSCLIAACGAVGVGTYSQVVVPSLTMSATAAAPKFWGGDVIFCDIEPDYFCLDPKKVRDIPVVNAIITVDLFGQSSNPNLNSWSLFYDDTPIIQDASQRPIPGGFGDIVVHSLNYHKHIHCGEGGMACTNDDELAKKLRLIRNHAENAGVDYFGFNFRMTEIEAAIARVQLTKLPAEIQRRQENARFIRDLAPVRPGFDHAWYLYPHTTRIPEGFRYAKPLYNLPVFSAESLPVTEQVWKSIWMTRP
jgi:dTDP-4-amino-4,6-dideoxygalactose transaminase